MDPAPAAPGSTRGPCRAVPAPLTDAALPFRSTGRLQPRGGGLSRGYPVALRARPWRRRTERRGWPPPACAPRWTRAPGRPPRSTSGGRRPPPPRRYRRGTGRGVPRRAPPGWLDAVGRAGGGGAAALRREGEGRV